MSTFSAKFLGKSRVVWLATAFVALVCLSLVLLDGWRSLTARSTQLQEGRTAAKNLSKSLAQHANDAFSQADTILFDLKDRIETGDASEEAMHAVHGYLVREVRDRPQIQRLAIIDANARWVTTSLPSIRLDVDHDNDEYLEFHREHESGAAHLGKPVRSWTTREWILPITRRLNFPDGSFAGVVVVAFDLEYFNRYYGRFDLGERGAITLVTFEGKVLDRRPFEEKVLGTSVAGTRLFKMFMTDHNAGDLTVVSPFDGVERLAAFKSADDYPVFVTVALSTDELLKEWRSDSLIHSVGVWLLSLTLGVIGYRLIGQIQRRAHAERELSASKSELEELNARLALLATTDGLTGLANRREFDRVLADEVARSNRTDTALSLIMIDVDHFKAYNDAYGHQRGDECLRAISDAVGHAISRPNDVAARYGGEEMAVVLPSTDLSGALKIAESIRLAVFQLDLEHEGSHERRVTVSLGVACRTTHGPRHDCAQLISEADAALYLSKRNGRNTVSLMQPALAA